MRPGHYAYRFGGFAMKPPAKQYHLVGAGTITLTGNKITGFHSAAYTKLTQYDSVQCGHFRLNGDYGPRKGGDGDHDIEATITFTQIETDVNGKPKQVLKGTFALVPAGSDDGFWLISTGAHHTDTNQAAVELVSGEAIRIRDPEAAYSAARDAAKLAAAR
ncbi:MAG TPA: hypothetical protein VEF55_13360 [Candidatus Binatia bacterium]|nr:hypothetical protein [Candidatus Binatia bacterium]